MPKLYMGKAKGESLTRVTVNGVPLNPRHDLRNHSPDGFSWGYGGSGPAQTALALLADATGRDDVAQSFYQYFKEAIVSRIPQDSDWEMTDTEILENLEKIREVMAR